MIKAKNVRLFVKPWCGWCDEAEGWLQERGIPYQLLDVFAEPSARAEMLQLSGQTKAPVIDVDGQILADFDTAQLEKFWSQLQAA